MPQTYEVSGLNGMFGNEISAVVSGRAGVVKHVAKCAKIHKLPCDVDAITDGLMRTGRYEYREFSFSPAYTFSLAAK